MGDTAMIGAIDIGGTKISVGLSDEKGMILCHEECPTVPERGFSDAISRMAAMLRRCLATSKVKQLQGIGIGCTGPVDPERGIIGKVPFLPGWEEGKICKELADIFHIDVALENDADAHTLGEYAWGSGKGAKNFIMVTVGTGIGGGIIMDGTLYRGAGGSHPEIGHHVIDPHAGPCSCGAHGCWESLACGPALELLYAMRYSDMPALDGKKICEAAFRGDKRAQGAIDTVGEYLGVGLANLITLFAPDRIALGGGLMKSASLFMPKIQAALRANCRLMPTGVTKLVLSELNGQSGLSGAASAWIHRYSKKVAAQLRA